MSDWDADSADEVVAPAAPKVAAPLPAARRSKFEDEDAEDDIKDDWEEDDEPAPVAPAALPPAKKKGTVKQKIKEKEEEERRRAELGIESEEEEDEDDPVARKKAERDAQIKADIDNAANLLGVTRVVGSDDSTASLRNAKPNTKDEWESFATELYDTLIKKQAGRDGFGKHFAPAFAKLLASEGLRDVDMRKMSTQWKDLADKKTIADKEAKRLGGKKPVPSAPKPKTVGTSSAKNVIDTRAYGDEVLDDGDDLDFM